jgi:Transposase
MKGKRFTEEQIIAVLKEHEAGAPTKDLCRRHGISEQSRAAMRIAGGLGRVETRVAPAVSLSIWPRRRAFWRDGGPCMRSSRPPQGGTFGRPVPGATALPALLRATHLLGLALGSALGRLRDSGVTAARMFEKAEQQALLLRTREAAGILGARWDKVPERHRPYYAPEQRFRILRIRTFLGLL